MEIRLLAAEGKEIMFSRVIVCWILASSLIVNCTVLISSANELHATPLTPIVVDITMDVNSSSWEHIW